MNKIHRYFSNPSWTQVFVTIFLCILVLALFAVLSWPAHAVTATVSPYPKFKAFNPGTGDPLFAGKLYTCVAGTTCGCSTPASPKTTYTDSAGGTPNANPVILDTNGEANVWLDGYTKLTLCDSTGALIWTVDNVSSGSATSAAAASVWVAQTGPFTYGSGTTFTVAGNQTATYVAGMAIKATDGGGTYTGIISSAAYTSVTTVTVVWAAGQALNNTTISNVYLGFVGVGPMTKGVGIEPVQTKTANYTLTVNDINQTIEFSGTGNALSGTWTNSSGNIYYISVATQPAYVFSGATPARLGFYIAPSSSTGLPSNYWWYDTGNSRVYVNIGGNPTGGTVIYSLAATLPAANAVPSGSWYRLKANNSAGLRIIGTVDGYVNPTVGVTGSEIVVWSDGIAWHGKYPQKTNAVDSNLVNSFVGSGSISGDSAILQDVNGNLFVTGKYTSGTNVQTTLDTGTSALSTWYYLWLLAKPDGTLITRTSLSSSLSGVSLPSGYVYGKMLTPIFNYTAVGNSTVTVYWPFITYDKEVKYIPYVNILSMTHTCPTSYTVLNQVSAASCTANGAPTSCCTGAGAGATCPVDITNPIQYFIPSDAKLLEVRAAVVAGAAAAQCMDFSLNGTNSYSPMPCSSTSTSAAMFLSSAATTVHNSLVTKLPLTTAQSLWYKGSASTTNVYVDVIGFTIP